MLGNLLKSPISNYLKSESFRLADKCIQHACFTRPETSYTPNHEIDILNKVLNLLLTSCRFSVFHIGLELSGD